MIFAGFALLSVMPVLLNVKNTITWHIAPGVHCNAGSAQLPAILYMKFEQ
jgi:hypothetical protein